MIAMSKLLLILLILASTNVFAGISKWVDAQGRVHYSDQPPPPDAQTKTLRHVSGTEDTAGSGVAETKTAAEREAELKRANLAKQAETDKAAQKKAAEDALKINCASAQESLRSLRSGERMMVIDANGQRSFMDDAQRQQRIAKIQQDISTNCK